MILCRILPVRRGLGIYIYCGNYLPCLRRKPLEGDTIGKMIHPATWEKSRAWFSLSLSLSNSLSLSLSLSLAKRLDLCSSHCDAHFRGPFDTITMPLYTLTSWHTTKKMTRTISIRLLQRYLHICAFFYFLSHPFFFSFLFFFFFGL